MSYVLDLVRHGEAMASGPGGDAGRTLSPRGRADIARLAERLRADGAVYTRALSSPLARARETASILLGEGGSGTNVEIAAALAPEGEPEEAYEELVTLDHGPAHVLIVSHQPFIGRFAAWLTGEPCEFRPGTCVRIEFEADPAPREGRIVQRIHPQPGS